MQPLPMIAGLVFALIGPARAEFVLRAGPAPAPVAAAQDLPPISAPPVRRVAPVPRAEGFGQDVPLGIAARMIVPTGTAIDLGESVDGEAPVSWTGGRAWNLVLADAVKPLGLKVMREPGRVRIIH